ncbi:hypothetical protein [Flavobacterium caeni]|uniref:hypothetical protein n=1 Tax=Flavobacterium caeni TaxID=490189 RepID=UPI0011131E9A|nr:hypothetical protein [Flavobacterium caeni]
MEEALLLASSYGYVIDSDIKASVYKEIKNGYVFHLQKFHDSPYLDAQGKEAIEVTITKEGFIKSRTLGFYCKGSRCL